MDGCMPSDMSGGINMPGHVANVIMLGASTCLADQITDQLLLLLLLHMSRL